MYVGTLGMQCVANTCQCNATASRSASRKFCSGYKCDGGSKLCVPMLRSSLLHLVYFFVCFLILFLACLSHHIAAFRMPAAYAVRVHTTTAHLLDSHEPAAILNS